MKGIFELEDEDMQVNFAPQGEKNLMIVDSLNLAFRYKQQSLFDHSAPYMRTINSLAKSYGCDNIIMASDWGSSKWRKYISAGEYKANREAMRKEQTKEEAEKFQKFFEGFEKALDLVGAIHPVIKLRGVEADDIAGYIVKNYYEEFDNIWLISSDKDWDLLLKPNVHRFSYVTREEYTLDNFAQFHDGCETPEDYVSMKVFAGDKGDNVDGFAGVGGKRAYNLIKQYGTALDVYDQIPLPGKQKYIQALNDNPEKILLNYELMDILSFCTDAIKYPEPSNVDRIIEVVEELLENES